MAGARTVITITHGNEAYPTISNKMLKDPSLSNEEGKSLRNFFNELIGRDRAASLTVAVDSGDAVYASATLTVSSGATSDTGVVNGTTFTCVDHREKTDCTYAADSSGSLNSTFFTLQDVTGAHKYYVWFNINSAGVDPAIAGRIGIKISGATGALAATLGAATTTACATAAYRKMTVPSDSSGSLNSTYFTVRDNAGRNKYYVWFNINSAGVDPKVAGYIGIQVNGATNATGTTLATACFTAANAISPSGMSGLSIVNPSATVIEFYESDGIAPIIQDGPTVATSTQGVFAQPVQGILVSNGSSGHVIFQNSLAGVGTKVTDGSAATSFTFTRSITGSALTAIQYNLAASDTLTAVNLAAAINANTTANVVTGATNAAGVVTVKSKFPGVIGNGLTLTASGNVTASAATLGSGAAPTSQTAVNTYHFGV